MKLEDVSIIAWLLNQNIKTETGKPVSFDSHLFLFDIYRDFSPVQVQLKAPQIGMTVLNTLKSFYVAKNYRKDIIYTLPTQADVVDMAGGKVNRIIAQNPILRQWVKDHDTVEQKTVGDSIIYYRGTWTTKQAMMVSSGLNIHDEVDASKQDVIEQYETRLQANSDGWRWYFSHPSLEGIGVDKHWKQSDQKHWFIKCSHCSKKQYLSWPENVDLEQQAYVCKHCHGILSDKDRRNGEWVRKYRDKSISGYWISQLMCPWIPATKIIDDYLNKPADYFANYVLGLPYVGAGNKVAQDLIFKNLTPKMNTQASRLIIGVDPGIDIRYVLGNAEGLFYYGQDKTYDRLDHLMKTNERAVMVIDAGGDLIEPRKLRAKYPGRVFLCHYAADRKTMQLIRWGDNDEDGNVIVDRNRMIQFVIDEFADKRIPLQGNETDWYDYWLHWSHIYRIKEFDERLQQDRYAWVRSDRDDWVHATLYWRVGMDRFSEGKAAFFTPDNQLSFKTSYPLTPDHTTTAPNPKRLFIFEDHKPEQDWRKV